jgi:SAM-dependent methyltransferase
MSLLEVGTGSGGIAHYFAGDAAGEFEVTAVDIADTRIVRDGYAFSLIDSTTLPFEPSTFDFVVTNHVIEHVGDRAAQLHHLLEIARVLRPEGRVYFAVPNRWMLMEPHYRLPFLSWLPRSWRSAYVRLSGRGSHYDCEPLTLPEIESLALEAGFRAENVSITALSVMREVEGTRGMAMWIVQRLSPRTLSRLAWLIPTHIYVFRLCSANNLDCH